ncbi:MAG: transposase [Bacteroidetes bacterium]|nr:transposase [Bacteroidota bacterium]
MYHHYYNLYFTTATILQWKHLLRNDEFKEIIIESMRFLVQEKRAVIYEFVIMPNHIHLIWQIPEPHTLSEVQSALLSYTAHEFKKLLNAKYPAALKKFKVNLKDRAYQFWKRSPLSIPIFWDKVFYQKARYIHWNPCTEKWMLAKIPEEYRYSSAYKSDQGGYWDFVTAFGSI